MLKNESNVSLPLAMFLAHDDYDMVKEPNYISATALIKPIRAIILEMRVDSKGKENDVLDFLASRIGTASHDRLEKAFMNGNHVKNMRKLGYPQSIIDRIKINPETLNEGDIPIYLEQRTIKPLMGYSIGGKFDVILEDTVRDLKTTKVFKWLKGDFEDYQLQGSIYRWLNPDKIKNDIMFIDFLFNDWKKYEADAKPEYPQKAAQSKQLALMSYEATEEWLVNKLTSITNLMKADQDKIPECTQKDLWMDPPKYAYFKSPEGKRATKVFDNQTDANDRLMKDNSVGKIEVRMGQPKRCNYCNASPICNQYKNYLAQGIAK